MNIVGVGPLELVVILIVALIFVGPERLPKLAADLARTIREIRKYTSSLAAEFNEVVQEIERETLTEKEQWKEIGQGLSDATKSVSDELQAAQSDAVAVSAKPDAQPAAMAAKEAPAAPTGGASVNGAAALPAPVEEPR